MIILSIIAIIGSFVYMLWDRYNLRLKYEQDIFELLNNKQIQPEPYTFDKVTAWLAESYKNSMNYGDRDFYPLARKYHLFVEQITRAVQQEYPNASWGYAPGFGSLTDCIREDAAAIKIIVKYKNGACEFTCVRFVEVINHIPHLLEPVKFMTSTEKEIYDLLEEEKKALSQIQVENKNEVLNKTIPGEQDNHSPTSRHEVMGDKEMDTVQCSPDQADSNYSEVEMPQGMEEEGTFNIQKWFAGIYAHVESLKEKAVMNKQSSFLIPDELLPEDQFVREQILEACVKDWDFTAASYEKNGLKVQFS